MKVIFFHTCGKIPRERSWPYSANGKLGVLCGDATTLRNLVGEEASLVAGNHAGDWSLLSLIAVFTQEHRDINGHTWTLCLGEKVMS